MKDENNIRTNFKNALALAYEVSSTNIALEYFATGTTSPAYTGRRRRNLLQVQNSNTGGIQTLSFTLNADIRSFSSIPLPTDSVAMTRLRMTYPNLVQYATTSSIVPANNGFSLFGFSLMWVIIGGASILLCLCVVFGGVCVAGGCCRSKEQWEPPEPEVEPLRRNSRYASQTPHEETQNYNGAVHREMYHPDYRRG